MAETVDKMIEEQKKKLEELEQYKIAAQEILGAFSDYKSIEEDMDRRANEALGKMKELSIHISDKLKTIPPELLDGLGIDKQQLNLVVDPVLKLSNKMIKDNLVGAASYMSLLAKQLVTPINKKTVVF